LNLFEKNVLKTIFDYKMLNEGDRVIVGLSGGADSCALLVVLNELSKKLGFSLAAAHLNHGIRGEEALRDMNFSEEFAKRLDIPFYSKIENVPDYAAKENISEEMAGRELRYAFFNELCEKNKFNKIAVAHNKNDSAETILMNLSRGSGAQGMSGIPPVNEKIIRPLIKTCRKDIEAYLREKDISYITDSTNFEDIYSRNILRNNVFPQLSRINTNCLNNIVKCADIIFDEHSFLCEYSKKLNALTLVNDKTAFIALDVFNKQHIAIKRTLIFNAIKSINGNTTNLSSVHVEAIIIGCKTGSVIELPCGICVIFEYDRIVFTKEKYNTDEYEYPVTLPGKITVKETGLTYHFEFTEQFLPNDNSQYINLDNAVLSNVILRTKHDGDTFVPYGMNSSKKIKSFFIDNKIPKHKRNKYPLLVLNNDIAAVIPLRVSDKYKTNKTTKKILKITVTGGKNEQ